MLTLLSFFTVVQDETAEKIVLLCAPCLLWLRVDFNLKIGGVELHSRLEILQRISQSV